MIAGLKVYGVNHLPGRQDKTKPSKDCGCRVEIHGDSQKIAVGTDGEIIRHDKDGCGERLAIGQFVLEFDRDQLPQEAGQITFKNLTQNGLLPLVRLHFQDVLGKL